MRAVEPAAEFLLDLAWHNLFERTSAAPGAVYDYRCKGCGDIVTIGKREAHFTGHLRARERDARRRQEALTRQRVANLRRGRAAAA